MNVSAIIIRLDEIVREAKKARPLAMESIDRTSRLHAAMDLIEVHLQALRTEIGSRSDYAKEADKMAQMFNNKQEPLGRLTK